MVHLIKKVKGGRVYLYLQENARVNGKVTRLWQKYLGPLESVQFLSKVAAPAGVETESLEFGLVAALLAVARKLDLTAAINRAAGKRDQGLSVGDHVLIAAINRCVYPASKTQLRHWCESTALRNAYPDFPTCLDARGYWAHFQYLTEGVVERIGDALARAAAETFGVNFGDLLFDSTNFFTYINPGKVNQQLARHGHPKDGKAVLNLVSVSLACALDGGVPLTHLVYPGNVQDAKHFKLAVQQLARRVVAAGAPAGARVTLAFDKGCLSEEAFSLIDAGHLDFVASVRPSSHKDLLDFPPADFPMFTLPNGKSLGVREFRRELYGKERRIVALYNPAQAAWLQRNLEAKVAKKVAAIGAFFQHRLNAPRWRELAKVLAKCAKLAGTKRFQGLVQVEVAGEPGALSLKVGPDLAAIEVAERRLGKAFLATSREDLAPEAVAWAFRQQYRVEDAFERLKDPRCLSVRPMFHRVDSSVRGHVFTCFVGLLLLALLARELAQGHQPVGIRRAVHLLKEIRVTRITVPGRKQPIEVLDKMSPEARALFDILHLEQYLQA